MTTATRPRLRVLGPVAVESATGEQLTASPRIRRLLAALLVAGDDVVSVDRLADVVWGDDPPAHVDGAVQTLVSRLRRLLRQAGIGGADGSPLVTAPPGYVLRVDDDEVDGRRFARLVADAHTAAPADALAGLDAALALWRGTAYAGLAGELFVRPEAVRLDELRTTAAEERALALAALGRHHEAIAAWEALVAEHPLRERPHAELMHTLHHVGRTPDALAVYRDFRARLDDELGIEPSRHIEALHTAVLRRDPDLDLRDGTDDDVGSAAPATDPGRRGHRWAEGEPAPRTIATLPQPVTELIGRDTAVAAVADLLDTARVVTLTGPGGVGKTALALAAAHRTAPSFTDGACAVELTGVGRDRDVAEVVTTALDLPRQQTGPSLQRLIDALRHMRVLLVLDNCEHVVAGVAGAVSAVTRVCPDVVVLATSREPLGVPGEHVWPVQPLAVTDGHDTPAPAVELFVERARAAAPAFAVTPRNRGEIARLCAGLDGLPLAIELAAMRMRAMTPAEVLDRLPARLRFLRSTTRVAEQRHRTLRAVFEWSYDLLTPDEQAVFELLSVFAGSFTLDAAERVAARAGHDPVTTVEAVTALVDKSLVVARPDDRATRYALLETLRGYGQELLAEHGTRERVARAHAEHCLAFAERAAADLWGPDQRAVADAITREFAELRAAHAWALDADLTVAAGLVSALAGYVELRMTAEIHRWAERTLDAAERADHRPPALAMVHAVVAGGARHAGEFAAARDHAERALASDPATAADAHGLALYVLSDLAVFTGDLDAGMALSARVRALPTDSATAWLGRFVRANEALAHAYAGRPDEARSAARGLVDGDEVDAPNLVGWERYCRAEALVEHDPAGAAELVEEALACARETPDRLLLGVTLVSAASVQMRLGRLDRALELYAEVIGHWQRLGTRTILWTSLRHVVTLLAQLDAVADATTLHGVLATRATAAPIYGADRRRFHAAHDELRARLGTDAFADALDRGERMSDDEAIRFAASAVAAVRRRTTPG